MTNNNWFCSSDNTNIQHDNPATTKMHDVKLHQKIIQQMPKYIQEK
jgi:hypothetical protein